MLVTKRSNPVSEYFGTVWNAVRTTLVGLGITGRYLFKKPVTMQYPQEKPQLPEGYRGLHIYEIEKCIACDMCATACPVDCIFIESIGKGKTAQLTRYEIDYNRCIFCGLCVEACPTSCLHMGKSYDLTAYASSSSSVDFVRLWHDKHMRSPAGDTIEPSSPKDQN
jgi:NADH-quinone oxidoreductase subunit I